MTDQTTTTEPAKTQDNPPSPLGQNPLPPISQVDTTSVAPVTPVALEEPPATMPAPLPGGATVLQKSVPAAPILVTPEEVAETPSEPDRLAEEVEILTGEVQALESKIERLTSNTEPTAPTKPAETPPAPEETPKPIAVPASSTPSVPMNVPSIPPAAEFKPFDITKKPEVKPTESTPLNEEAHSHPSVLGVMGEIIGVIGVIMFLLLIASPAYKAALGDIWTTVANIGWLTTLVALLLGLIFSFFAKGQAVLKVLMVVFLLITLIIYLGNSSSGSAISVVTDPLRPLLDLYR